MPDPVTPRRRIARRWKVLAALLLGLVALIAALPLAIGTPPARRWLLSRANRVLAPSRLHCDGLRVSWNGPTRLSNAVLFDAQGDQVVTSSRAIWDRNLFRILFDPDHRGTLTLEGARLDVERFPDGSLDIVDALAPILRPNPKIDFHLRIPNGSLRFRSPELAEPLLAESASLDLDIPSALRPLKWALRLENGAEKRRETLEIVGKADRPHPGQDGPTDLSVTALGTRWPLALNVARGIVRGCYDGKTEADRGAGRWTIAGEARILDVDANLPTLSGDRLQFDKVGGSWRLVQAEEGWQILGLDVRSPVGSIKASGRMPAMPGESARIEGTLDLAALLNQLPQALPMREGLTLVRGEARLLIDAKAEPGRATWDASARITDLVARDSGRSITLSDPATLSARWVGEGGGINLDHLGLKTSFLDARASGDLDRGITLDGSIDLGGLRKQVGEILDLGPLEMEGKGRLTGTYGRAKVGQGYDSGLELAMNGVQISGTPLGPIRGDTFNASTHLGGPISPSGIPQGWESFRLGAVSAGSKIDLAATHEGEAIDLVAKLATPFRLSDRDSLAGGDLRGRWQGDVLRIDLLTLDLRPIDQEGKALSLSAHGQFDGVKGVLTLAAPEGASGAIVLSPEGVRVSGIGRKGQLDARVALNGNLAPFARALGAWTDALPAGLSGAWNLDASARALDEGLRFGGKVEVSSLEIGQAGDVPGRPLPGIVLYLQGLRPTGTDRLDFREFVLATRYATLDASGSLDDPGGRRLADFRGTLAPDWPAINEALGGKAHFEGKARPFRLKGPLSGDSAESIAKGLDAEVGLDLAGAESFGMHLGPASIVARLGGDGLVFDPIQSTLNGGKVAIEPEIGRDGAGDLVVRLKPGGAVEGAEINDEVSRKVLAFVAPVLDSATRARGKVSVDVQRAEFPIGGDSTRRSVVEGHVVFQEAEFAPGPLAVGLLRLAKMDEEATLKLDQPVVLSVADGKVYQRGLAVPLGRLTRVELDGAVGFDRSLDLKASLPLTPAMVNNNPLLGDIIGGARVSVPIGGTLDAPKIDRDAFNVALKGLGKDLLQRGAVRGASELLMRLAKPREVDPNAPPPPSPEERRALRQRRKAERQERRAERRGDLPP